MTLPQFAQEIMDRAERKEDFIHSTRDMGMSEDGQTLYLNANDGGREFKLQDLAHEQIGAWAGIPRGYYRKCQQDDTELLKTNVEAWFRKYGKPRMVRTLDGHARAFLSDTFLRLDDQPFAEKVLPVVHDYPQHEIVSCAIEPERTYIKFVCKDLQRDVAVGDPVQFGIAFSNSEVGRGYLKGQLLIYRLVCLNGMTSTDDVFNGLHRGARHTRYDTGEIYQLDTLKADGEATLLKLRDFARHLLTERRIDEVTDKLTGMTQQKIGKPVETVAKLAKSKGLTEGEQTSVLEHLIKGGDLSLWGLTNAITASAQDDNLTYTRASELEALGGSMLTLNRFEYRQLADAA